MAAASLCSALVVAVPGGSAGATGSGGAHAKSVTISTAKVSGVGTVLTTASGLTLYRFTEDTPGASSCSGACAKIWPPLVAAKGAHLVVPHGLKGVSLVHVGSHWQVALHKLPLYTFEGGKKKGQANGQNVGKVWFAVLKNGTMSTAAAAVPATSTTAPATSTTAPATSTTQGSSSNFNGSSVTTPTQTPTPVTQAPPPTTTPPTSPPPPTTTTTAGSGGYGY